VRKWLAPNDGNDLTIISPVGMRRFSAWQLMIFLRKPSQRTSRWEAFLGFLMSQ
jgi:hypothetical protein